jgi:hypothetical protein
MPCNQSRTEGLGNSDYRVGGSKRRRKFVSIGIEIISTNPDRMAGYFRYNISK